jgi:uncharacterized membrane protein
MSIGMRRNVGSLERAGSVATGIALLYLAMRERRHAFAAASAGAGFLLRGALGYCPVNAATGRDTNDADTRRALGGRRGVHVRESVTIARPVGEVYHFWRDLPNLARFMTHVERIDVLDEKRSHWVVVGPAGSRVEWDAEIIAEEDGARIAWRSLEDADVVSAGSVNFRPIGRTATQINVHLQYEPPAGKAGAFVAWVMGREPAQEIREDLRRLRQLLETGETPTVEGQPSGRAGR